MNTLVSVIVPVYNIGEYIEKCLESLVSQRYRELEIIVVDDGSTDNSAKICDKFAKKDARVKIFHKKNGGLSAARNFGIKKARGELIALVDGDDFVKSGFISEMVQAMKEEIDIVVCGYNEIVPKRENLNGKAATERLLIRQDNLEIVVWNKLYRREIFSGIEYPEGEKYEDSLTTYKFLAKARKVSYVGKSLYNYVSRDESIMGQSEVLERLKIRQKAAEEALKYFKDDEGLYMAAEAAMLTAKYAFMDAAIKKEISWDYYILNSAWIKKYKILYDGNKLINKKLKFYNFLNSIGLYRVFRTII